MPTVCKAALLCLISANLACKTVLAAHGEESQTRALQGGCMSMYKGHGSSDHDDNGVPVPAPQEDCTPPPPPLPFLDEFKAWLNLCILKLPFYDHDSVGNAYVNSAPGPGGSSSTATSLELISNNADAKTIQGCLGTFSERKFENALRIDVAVFQKPGDPSAYLRMNPDSTYAFETDAVWGDDSHRREAGTSTPVDCLTAGGSITQAYPSWRNGADKTAMVWWSNKRAEPPLSSSMGRHSLNDWSAGAQKVENECIISTLLAARDNNALAEASSILRCIVDRLPTVTPTGALCVHRGILVSPTVVTGTAFGDGHVLRKEYQKVVRQPDGNLAVLELSVISQLPKYK